MRECQYTASSQDVLYILDDQSSPGPRSTSYSVFGEAVARLGNHHEYDYYQSRVWHSQRIWQERYLNKFGQQIWSWSSLYLLYSRWREEENRLSPGSNSHLLLVPPGISCGRMWNHVKMYFLSHYLQNWKNFNFQTYFTSSMNVSSVQILALMSLCRWTSGSGSLFLGGKSGIWFRTRADHLLWIRMYAWQEQLRSFPDGNAV